MVSDIYNNNYDSKKFIYYVINNFITGKSNINYLYPNKNDNRNCLSKIINRNGIAPIFLYTINSSQIPKDLFQSWKVFSIQTLVQYLRALKTTASLFRILENENIPSVAMRGIALAEWVYPEPNLRPMKDVDILIPSNYRDKLFDSLKKYNLSPLKKLRSQFVYIIDGIVFEIHYSYLTPKRYKYSANFNKWIYSRTPVLTSEGVIYRLKLEDALLDSILHVFIHHELDRFLQIIDIALLLNKKGLDWNYIFNWCRESSLLKIVLFTISYVCYSFELELDSKITQFKQNESTFKSYASQLFYEDSIRNYLNRKKNLLFITEKNSLLVKQVLRFISIDEVRNVLKYLTG